MAIVEIESRVGPDGVLTLSVPVGTENANREVKVTISDVVSSELRRPTSESEWKAFLARTAGSIDDPTFMRPRQEAFEERGEIFP